MNESRLLLLQLRRIIHASANVAGSYYKRTYYRRLSALNVLLQKQKLLEVYYPSETILEHRWLRKPIFPPALQQLSTTYKKRISALNGLLQKRKVEDRSLPPNFFKPTAVPFTASPANNSCAQQRIKTEIKRPPLTTLLQDDPKDALPSTTNTNPLVENIWTIPNALCVLRIGMAPVLAYMVLHNQFGPAIGVFMVAGVTDLLDGWIARLVPGQASVMGSFLDPMADKILVGTLFLSLTYVNLIPVALTSLIIGRDAILIAFGFYIRYQSLDPPKTLSRYFNVAYPTAQLAPTMISKINTGVQLGLIGATLASSVLPYNAQPYLEFLWYLTAATTAFSAVSYCFAKDTVKLLQKHGPKLTEKRKQ